MNIDVHEYKCQLIKCSVCSICCETFPVFTKRSTQSDQILNYVCNKEGNCTSVKEYRIGCHCHCL